MTDPHTPLAEIPISIKLSYPGMSPATIKVLDATNQALALLRRAVINDQAKRQLHSVILKHSSLVAVLEGWSYEVFPGPKGRVIILNGIVTNHFRLPDNMFIHTSALQDVYRDPEGCDSRDLFITRNSIYRLGKPQGGFSNQQLCDALTRIQELNSNGHWHE